MTLPGTTGTQGTTGGATGAATGATAGATQPGGAATQPPTQPGGTTDTDATRGVQPNAQGTKADGTTGNDGKGKGTTDKGKGTNQAKRRTLAASVAKEVAAVMGDTITKREEAAAQRVRDEIRAANGDFEPLYKELRPQFDTLAGTLQTVTTRFDDISGTLEDWIDTATEDWPDEVRRMDPAHEEHPKHSSYTVEERRDYYITHKELAKRLMGESATSAQVPPAAPPPAGGGTMTIEQAREKYLTEERAKAQPTRFA